MKEKSLIRNTFMNVSNQISAFLFPLITFPYVSRILQPEGLGKINFAQAVVSYFILIAALGIPTYGMREVSKIRSNKLKKAQLVAELFFLNMITATITFLLFCAFMAYSEKAESEQVLFWLCIIPMILSPFEFSFLFEGNEEFTYIAIRSILFRVINICAIYIFIRDQSDYITLALINGLIYLISIISNLIFIKTQIDFNKISWSKLAICKHIRPTSTIFLFGGIICLYTSLDKVMLGYLANDEQVGFYTVSDKLVKVIIMGITAFNSVLTPRVISYVENKQFTKFHELTRFSLNIILFLAFPCAFGLFILADSLVILFGGSSYVSSINLIQIMSVNIIFISLSSFVGFQILYANNKEKLLLYSVAAGASANLLLNLMLIPKLQAYGAAISTLISEVLVTLIQIILSRSVNIFKWPLKEIMAYFISAFSMATVLYFLVLESNSIFMKLALCIPVAASIYLLMLYFLKDPIVHYIINKSKKCSD